MFSSSAVLTVEPCKHLWDRPAELSSQKATYKHSSERSTKVFLKTHNSNRTVFWSPYRKQQVWKHIQWWTFAAVRALDQMHPLRLYQQVQAVAVVPLLVVERTLALAIPWSVYSKGRAPTKAKTQVIFWRIRANWILAMEKEAWSLSPALSPLLRLTTVWLLFQRHLLKTSLPTIVRTPNRLDVLRDVFPATISHL